MVQKIEFNMSDVYNSDRYIYYDYILTAYYRENKPNLFLKDKNCKERSEEHTSELQSR